MPLVLIRLPPGTKDPPDLPALIADLDALLARRERIVIAMDLTGAAPDAGRRKATVDWLKKNQAALERYVVAFALVAPSAFHRGLFVATQWFVKMPNPVEVFGDLSSALAWSHEKMHAAGLRPASPRKR